LVTTVTVYVFAGFSLSVGALRCCGPFGEGVPTVRQPADAAADLEVELPAEVVVEEAEVDVAADGVVVGVVAAVARCGTLDELDEPQPATAIAIARIVGRRFTLR
jgi:hypothetical protein